jgi:acetoin utilization protein AcuB
MVKDPVTINPHASLKEAVEIMHKYSIRHLPVVEGAALLGMVTQSSIRQYFFPSVFEEFIVSDIMIINPITIDVNASIDAAAKLLYQYKIGGLPVLEKRKLVGIFTTTDVVAAFIEFLGLLHRTSRIDVTLSEKEGTLDDVISLIRKNGGEIISLVADAQPLKKKIYYIRLEKGDVLEIAKALEEEGHKVVSILD